MKKIKMEYKITEKFTKKHIKEIEKIEKTKGLTAETLLENAEDKKSPFHNFFEWNNDKAGELWRLHKARLIINEIKVVYKTKELYAFENLQCSIEEREENGFNRRYFPIVEILNNKEKREELIKKALREAEYWKERHLELIELSSIFKEIEKVKKKFIK